MSIHPMALRKGVWNRRTFPEMLRPGRFEIASLESKEYRLRIHLIPFESLSALYKTLTPGNISWHCPKIFGPDSYFILS
jgi:hypothetical protein